MKRFNLYFLLFVFLFCSGTVHAGTFTGSWDTSGTGASENSTPKITFNTTYNLSASTLSGSNLCIKVGNGCGSNCSGTSCTGSGCSTSGHVVALSGGYPATNAPTPVVTLTPALPLRSGQQFTLCARTGIKNTRSPQDNLNAITSSVFTVRDYLNPTVASTTPTNNSVVSVATTATVTFSENMNASTVTAAGAVVITNTTDGVDVPVGSVTGTTTVYTITPSTAFVTGKTYRIVVKNTVTDSSGNAMVSDYEWYFSLDSTPPTMTSYTPVSPFEPPLSPVYVNSTTPIISALFAEAITAPTTSNFKLRRVTTLATNFGSGTDVTTTPSFNSGTRTATLSGFTLTNNYIYKVALYGAAVSTEDTTCNVNSTTAGIQDLASPANKMAKSVCWSFIVDTQAPSVLSVSPASGATNIATNSTVIIDFSDNVGMYVGSLNSTNIRLLYNDGTSDIDVPYSQSYNTTTKRLTITPAVELNYSTQYSIKMEGGGVKDLAGNPLPDFTSTFTTQAVSSVVYTQTPPFLVAPVYPNVLIILDNSNSMDEDMNVNAIGSPFCTNNTDPNTCSKSIIARKALVNIINTYANTMKLGLMSYKLGGARDYVLHNNFYFSSYNPETYCPTPPAACQNYCINEGTADKDACNLDCRTKNAQFDATVRDEILTTGTTAGSARRQTYCSLIYPKYQRVVNPTDPTGFVYYGLPGTLYAGSSWGTRFSYAESYNASTATDSYKMYSTKTGSSNGNVGFSGYIGSSSFTPSDSDLALGFEDFGRNNYWYYTSRTWSYDSSPGPGYVHVQNAVNVAATNTQKTALLAKLGGNSSPVGYENNETGYMTCESGSVNTCAHIINAGLTPTAGTLQSAIDYFKGTLNQGTTLPSPIEYSCQKNYVIYVTDGLPSVDESGTAGSASTLLPAVLTKLDNLRCPASGATTDNCKVTKTFSELKKFDVKTFIIGMGLNSAAQSSLDQMAVKGGTDVSGHAFYANDLTQLNNALIGVFRSIQDELASGTAASILNNSEGSGANMLQAVFYPKKTFNDATSAKWIGEIQNLWYYVDPYFQNSTIREDTVKDNILNLKQDSIVNYYFDEPTATTKVARFSDIDGNGVADTQLTTVMPDDVSSLWRAGRLLWERNIEDSAASSTYSPRNIMFHSGFTAALDGAVTDSATTGLTALSYERDATDSDVDLVERTRFKTWIQAASDTESQKIVKYLHGIDDVAYRSRKVTITGCGLTDAAGCTRTWKLGDIISSTPKLTSSTPLNSFHYASPNGYGDSSYESYYKSMDYKMKGMAFVGANDGLLHAFRIGKLMMKNQGSIRAKIEGSTTGKEAWAFLPVNMLPYLKYMMENNYDHLNYVDGPTLVTDLSINPPSDNDAVTYPNCDAANYWNCAKQTKYGATKYCSNNSATACTSNSTCNPLGNEGNECLATLDLDKTSWRTVLIGSTGLGGSSRKYSTSCYGGGTDCIKTPISDAGWSTYFALDVTDPENPKYLWEFDGARIINRSGSTKVGEDGIALSGNGWLGYATSGPLIVRQGAKGKNGRSFAVFASGPTGSINATDKQFMGRSTQNLYLFVVDVAKGTLVKTIDTGIEKAFAGSLSSGAVDTDRSRTSDSGFYQDDAFYVGYTQYNSASGKWDKGGVLRVLMNEFLTTPDPNDTATAAADRKPWKVSKVIENIGPVTTAVTKLQDRRNKKLWLYFGTGRYYFKTAAERDTPTLINTIYGIQEPCYDPITNDFPKTNTDCSTAYDAGGIVDKSSDAAASLPTGKTGWFVTLDASAGTTEAERIITDPVPSTGGGVFFTSFKPTSDICGYNGDFHIWAFDYATGGTPPSRIMQGTVMVQSSTGAFVSLKLATEMTEKDGRRSPAHKGTPPRAQGLALMTNPRPVKKIMHIMER